MANENSNEKTKNISCIVYVVYWRRKDFNLWSEDMGKYRKGLDDAWDILMNAKGVGAMPPLKSAKWEGIIFEVKYRTKFFINKTKIRIRNYFEK